MPTWAIACFGLSPRSFRPSAWSVSSRSLRTSRTTPARAISISPLPRGSSCRRTIPGRHLARPRIADRLERDLEPELAAQLDLDVADVPRPVDPPGVDRHEPVGRTVEATAAAVASPWRTDASGETSLPPRSLYLHERDGIAAPRSVAGQDRSNERWLNETSALESHSPGRSSGVLRDLRPARPGVAGSARASPPSRP